VTQAAQARQEVLEVGPLQIIPDEHLARAEGRALMLSIRELRLLTELARRADRIVTREELFRLVWGREMRVRDRSVDVYVRKLRVKLEAALPGWSFIHTHFGLGYRLAADSRQVITGGSQLINTIRRPGTETLPDSN
jgi:DNA-binding response OmpR family regulator